MSSKLGVWSLVGGLAFGAMAIGLLGSPALAEELSLEERARIAGYVQLLGDEDATTRADAEHELRQIGRSALTLLRKAQAESESAEVRRRAGLLVKSIQDALASTTGSDLVWAGLRGGPTRSGVIGGTLPAKQPTAVWTTRYPDADLMQGGVIPDGERVICLERGGVVRSFDSKDGKQRWLTHADSAITASGVLAAGRLAVPTGNALVVLDARSGRRLWDAEAPYGCNAAPAIQRGKVYASFARIGVRAFDLRSGERKFERVMQPSGALLVDGDLIVTGTDDGRLLRLHPEHGRTQWTVELGSPPMMGPTLAAPGVIVVYSEDRYIRGISAKSGDEIWSRRITAQSRSESLSAAAGRVFLTNKLGHLYCYDAGTGRMVWNRNPGMTRMGSPCATTDVVVFGANGRLSARDARSGDFLWRFDRATARDSTNPAAAGGRVYVLYDDALVAYE